MRAIGVLVALFVMTGLAAADVTDQKLADQKFIEGRDALKRNQFKEACTKFHEAQKHDPNAVVILLNLGLCYEKQGKLALALKWYRKTQTASTEAPDKEAVKENEAAAVEATNKLAKAVGKVTFNITALPPDAIMTIDGEQVIDRTELILEVDPGKRIIEARAPGKRPDKKELVVEANASTTFTFTALADDAGPPQPSRTKRRVLGAGIALGTATILGIATGIPANRWQAEHNATDDEDIRSNRKKKMRIAGAIFGVGTAAAVAVGAYLFFSTPKTEENRSAWLPVIAPDQLGFAYSRGF